MVVSLVLTAFWAMLPAYVPNNAAVLIGGGTPIDGGRSWGGRRILGDGKTWRGTAGGGLAGFFLALALNAVRADVVGLAGVPLPAFPPLVAFTLSFGAMLGDVASSFFKRRTGRGRGAPWPGVDQLDFVGGALLLTGLVAPVWFARWFTLPVIVVVLVVTPLLHVGTNAIGYALGFKDEPW